MRAFSFIAPFQSLAIGWCSTTLTPIRCVNSSRRLSLLFGRANGQAGPRTVWAPKLPLFAPLRSFVLLCFLLIGSVLRSRYSRYLPLPIPRCPLCPTAVAPGVAHFLLWFETAFKGVQATTGVGVFWFLIFSMQRSVWRFQNS